MDEQKAPKVSVCVITYNQEKYIRQCLQSIVDQKTDFKFEVVVGDDCSTDNTKTIIREFINRYPKVIKAIYQDKNTNGIQNYLSVHGSARGEYVAHIDGDDWILPGKLQKQVNYLENNPNTSIVVHDVKVMTQNGQIISQPHTSAPVNGSVYDLLKYGCYFCHSSKMYRKSANKTTSVAYPVIDFCLHIIHASKGDIHYIREVLGFHRINSNSITKSIRFNDIVHSYYEDSFDYAIKIGLINNKVEQGRIRYRQAIALRNLNNSNLVLFKKFAIIDNAKLRYATCRQIIIHLISKNDMLLLRLYRLYLFFINIFSKKHASY